MSDSLKEIAEAARIRVAERKTEMPIERLQALMEFMPIPVPGNPPGTGAYQTFQDALDKKGLSVIAELRVAPSIDDDPSREFPYMDIAYDYESGDADAISCIIEPRFFFGSEEMFTDIRNDISAPMLCRDFIVDPYQIYEAKNLGADAVILMCSLLDDEQLRECLKVCNELYIDALVMAENIEDVARAIDSNALIIGIGSFGNAQVAPDIDFVEKARELVPDDCFFVVEAADCDVESGVAFRNAGADALLVHDPNAVLKTSEERQTILRQLTEIE